MSATWLDVLDSFLRIVAALVSVSVVFLLVNRGSLDAILSFAKRRAYAKKTGRSVILVTHGKRGGMFGGGMLTMADVLKVERHLRCAKGRPVDVILTTFGGDLIAGLRLARVLGARPNARLVVPKYAFSAGTIVAVASRAILAAPDAMFGPIDPQIGWLFEGIHSAKDWMYAATLKGVGAKDSTIVTAQVARRLMEEMRGYVADLVPDHVAPGPVLGLLLDADASHARAIGPGALANVGLPIQLDECADAAHLVERSPGGVQAFILKGDR